MKIKKMLNKNRRDFTAIYICEHCDVEVKRGGYDDSHFHSNVIPKMECASCGKTAKDDYIPMGTRYPEGMQV